MTNKYHIYYYNKALITDSICTVIDALQEFGFNILIYFTNLVIIYTEQDFMNMLINCLAMEFLMIIDNEFEETYFKYQPEVALDIFDKLFVSYNENKNYVIDRMERDSCFRFFKTRIKPLFFRGILLR